MNYAAFITDKRGNGRSALTCMRTIDKKRQAAERLRLGLLSPDGDSFKSTDSQREQETLEIQRDGDPRLAMQNTGNIARNVAHDPELKAAREVRKLARLAENANTIGANAEATNCWGSRSIARCWPTQGYIFRRFALIWGLGVAVVLPPCSSSTFLALEMPRDPLSCYGSFWLRRWVNETHSAYYEDSSAEDQYMAKREPYESPCIWKEGARFQ